MNTVELQPMVRLTYNFPDVDNKKRREIYDVLFRRDLIENKFIGGHGDGSINSGVMYLPESDAKRMAAELEKLGLEVNDESKREVERIV